MNEINISIPNHHIDIPDIRNIFGLPRYSPYERPLPIKKVIFNDPATIVIWFDNTKTVVKCQPGDTYSEELGLAMCISKKFLGNKGNFNKEFKKWLPEKPEEPIVDTEVISIEEMRKFIRNYCDKTPHCDDCILDKTPNGSDGLCYGGVTDEVIIENYNYIKSNIKED